MRNSDVKLTFIIIIIIIIIIITAAEAVVAVALITFTDVRTSSCISPASHSL